MKKTLTLIIATIVLLATTVYAAIPHLINYQGKLTDPNGKPLENGSYNITFRIYDAENGGTMLWQGTYSVSIQKGIFSVLLGDISDPGYNFTNLSFDKPYYLAIKVGSDPEMSPRQKITSSGYAIRSETAENAIQAQNAATVANVGVSATPAANKILPLDSNAKLPLSALKVYDSGWFAVSASTSYTKTHSLGTTKVLTLVYVSNNSDGSGTCAIVHDADPMSVRYGAYMVTLSTTAITLRTGGYIYNAMDSAGNDVDWKSGYLRIIMLALE